MNQTIPQIADGVIEATKRFFVRSMEPLKARVQALEERAPGKDGRDGADGKDGADGQSVDPVQLAAQITEAAAKAVGHLPKPADGRDGRDYDPEVLEAAVIRHVNALPRAKDGRDGKDADAEFIAATVLEKVSQALDEIPIPKDGKDGRDGQDGKSVDPHEVEAMVRRHVEAIPKPQDGAAGRDGKDGGPGRDGKDFDPETLRAAVAEAVSRIPPAKDGERGADGNDGHDGIAGKDGAPGLNGKDGAPGLNGKDGEPGLNGKDGEPGKNGRDADMEALRAFLRELVAEAIKAIPTPKDGEKGDPGEKGEDGRDGREGEPGRDAPHVDVLDGIDEEKRYQRGVYATFRGGLIRSFRPTDPVTDGIEKAGWHVIVEGDAEDEIDLDERTLTVRKVKTSGRVIEKRFTVPVVIDRGVFKAGSTYDSGDAVTYGGSMFIAQRQTLPTEKPEDGSGAFRLAVKRGRDAS